VTESSDPISFTEKLEKRLHVTKVSVNKIIASLHVFIFLKKITNVRNILIRVARFESLEKATQLEKNKPDWLKISQNLPPPPGQLSMQMNHSEYNTNQSNRLYETKRKNSEKSHVKIHQQFQILDYPECNPLHRSITLDLSQQISSSRSFLTEPLLRIIKAPWL